MNKCLMKWCISVLLGTCTGVVHADRLNCFVEPKSVVDVGVSVGGVLQNVYVERGDRVVRGQRLAQLESGVEKAALEAAEYRARSRAKILSAEARRDFSERKYQRAVQLSSKEYVSSFDVDEAETERYLADRALQEAQEDHRLAALELKRVEAQLARRVVDSPLDGVVVQRYWSPGDVIDEGRVLQLAELDPLHLELVLPVDMLGKISNGMMANVTLEYPKGITKQAEVVVVDEVVNAESGTFGVRMLMPNPGYQVKPGVACKVTFIQES